ncbi:MAG TPA: 4-(cytidine 5'-diphospho)-2-C-methyl-D-erythritol kinase [Candidatus Tyrphobacter sp.]
MAKTLRAPAKINLTLEVLGRREDGYHGLRSVMVPLELADEIEVDPSGVLAFACDDASLAGDENLALRALRALASAGFEPHAKVTLRKRIPVEAGLGGGSSDAAAILLAAMEGVFGPAPALDWLAIGHSLGSDVPFFLARTAALVEGTGERVTALGAIPAWPVLIVRPPAHISTAEAYAALDRRERKIRPRSDSPSLACVEALQRGDYAAVEALLSNDFHDLAMEEPSVRRAVGALHSAGAQRPLLSGSGSCVFALAANVAARDAIAQRLQLPPAFAVFATAFASGGGWQAAGA